MMAEWKQKGSSVRKMKEITGFLTGDGGIISK
jgi:hypothetical protein